MATTTIELDLDEETLDRIDELFRLKLGPASLEHYDYLLALGFDIDSARGKAITNNILEQTITLIQLQESLSRKITG